MKVTQAMANWIFDLGVEKTSDFVQEVKSQGYKSENILHAWIGYRMAFEIYGRLITDDMMKFGWDDCEVFYTQFITKKDDLTELLKSIYNRAQKENSLHDDSKYTKIGIMTALICIKILCHQFCNMRFFNGNNINTAFSIAKECIELNDDNAIYKVLKEG